MLLLLVTRVIWESVNDPGEQLVFQPFGTHSVVVFQVRAFFSPQAC